MNQNGMSRPGRWPEAAASSAVGSFDSTRGNPSPQEVEMTLRNELEAAFGSVDDILSDMKVNVVFKGVTYESLTNSDFLKVASRQIPSLASLHDEFDAAPGGMSDNGA